MPVFNIGVGEPFRTPTLHGSYPADTTVPFTNGESKSATFEKRIEISIIINSYQNNHSIAQKEKKSNSPGCFFSLFVDKMFWGWYTVFNQKRNGVHYELH